MIRSRHGTHDPLRTELPRLPFRSVVRLGSIWRSDSNERIECNSREAVMTSASKRRMKEAFDRGRVKTAPWIPANSTEAVLTRFVADHGFPLVGKHINGSRGTGNTLIKDAAGLTRWLQGKDLSMYILEEFLDYSREYRLHVTRDGCFYTCRKMLKEETPDDERWYRNDSNCVWIMEENPSFDRPSNWNAIVAECVKALNAVGLDIGAMDVKVQSRLDKRERVRQAPEFFVIESGSAPSFGEVTLQKYLQQIPRILRTKFANQ